MNSYKLYDNIPVISRYSLEQKIDLTTAKVHFEALKDFLALASKTNKPCFPSGELDEVWHTFILFTRDYYTFCTTHLKNFIHHVPYNKDEQMSSTFTPGYLCFIQDNKLKKKFVRSRRALQREIRLNCGSGGDCSCSKCSKCGNDTD